MSIITIQQANDNHEKRINKREKYRKDFKEESHEMADMRDLVYWANVTGYEESYIIENARALNPAYVNAFNAGLSFDEMNDVKPISIYPDDDFDDHWDEETILIESI